MVINFPASSAGTSPGVPENSPPTLAPPMNTLGRELCPVISRRAARFVASLINPGTHSLPKLISLYLIPQLSNNNVASEQNGDHSYVS